MKTLAAVSVASFVWSLLLVKYFSVVFFNICPVFRDDF